MEALIDQLTERLEEPLLRTVLRALQIDRERRATAYARAELISTAEMALRLRALDAGWDLKKWQNAFRRPWLRALAEEDARGNLWWPVEIVLAVVRAKDIKP